jgi:hypothetical protein
MHIKRVLGPGGKVTSLAVIAPGNKPGCIGGGASTSPSGGSSIAYFFQGTRSMSKS